CSRNSSGSFAISLTSLFISDNGARGASLNLHAENLQNPLQLLIVEKPNLQQSFSLPIAKLHLSAKALAQSVLDISDMRVERAARHGLRIFRSAARLLILQP